MAVSWTVGELHQKTDPIFVKKACDLNPVLHKTEVCPSRVLLNHGEISFAQLKTKAWGRDDQFVLDFGNHYVGYVTLYLNACGGIADAPAFIKVKMCERDRELQENSADYHGQLGKGWIQEEWLHVDAFPAVIRLPRRYALRYLQVCVLDTSANYRLVLQHAVVEAVSSAPNRKVEAIAAQDPLLGKIDEVSLRTLHNCMQTVFEDGPKRDRRLWIGDLRLQALTDGWTTKNFALVKRCLYLFAGMTRDDGAVCSCLYAEPRMTADNIFLLDYSLFFVSILLDHYNFTQDIDVLRELAPTALRQIELAGSFVQENGILEPEGRYCCFIDWKDGLDKQAAMEGVYLYTLKRGAQLCRLTGREQQAQDLEQAYDAGCRAAMKVLWDGQTGLFRTEAARQISWASQIWLCIAGVLPPEAARKVFDTVAQCADAVGMTTPYIFHHYMEALLNCGEEKRAREEIRRYWGGMVNAGADTFWEVYDPQNTDTSPYGGCSVNSYCHAWSCTPAYLFRKYPNLLQSDKETE